MTPERFCDLMALVGLGIIGLLLMLPLLPHLRVPCA